MSSGSSSSAPRSSGSGRALLTLLLILAVIILASLYIAGRPHSPVHTPGTLRVCADPNNLPFSNRAEEGFENELARLVAEDLGTTVSYTWWPQRRGFVRNTLRYGACDVIMGVPSAFEMLRTTRPYYRSTYVFVSRGGPAAEIRSFEDVRLGQVRIGVHVIGDDYSNIPPVQSLALRGHIENVHGYSIYGDYSQPNPPRALIDAVARGDIDIAIAWGPLAGYFAARERTPLHLQPAPADPRLANFPTSYAISMGVRHEDEALHAALERILKRRATQIEELLRRYDVPLLPLDSYTASARWAPQ